MPNITIHPPLAGIVRARGFQKQPPYSCREAINFWPQFAVDGSETLAIRPPLDEYIAVASNPVNLLCRVNGTNSDTPQRTFVAAVNGQLKYWDGSALVNVGGAGSVPTTRAVFAAAFEQKVYIPGATNLVYDYPSDTLATWTASSGTVPSDMRILVFWAGGLWGAAQPTAPHIVSGCATGAPLNWLFSASGEGAAFQTTGDNAGLISDPVTALIPVSGDTMVVSTPDGMQAWRGHPRRGGVADILSSSIGVRGQGAWCQGPDGTVFALTNKGLSAISAGATSVSHISQDRIPNELIGYDYDYLDPRISMAFDNRFNGVHITVRDGDDSEGWFYDLKNGGLFEQEYAQYPHVMMPFDPIETGRASGVLFGGSGGLYRFDLDGTESINRARVVVGPIRLSNNAMERSKIMEAQVVMGGGTTAVDAALEFYCGPTCDSAYAASVSGNAAAKYLTTVDDTMAKHGRIRPLIAGHAATVVFDQPTALSNPKLVMEEITLHLEPAGRERAYVQHSDVTGPRAGSFTPPPLTDDLIAYYSLQEASGTRQDAHTGNLDLAIESQPASSAAGRVSNGVDMNPTGGSVILAFDGAVPSINLEHGVSLGIWFKYTSDGGGVNEESSIVFTSNDTDYQIAMEISDADVRFLVVGGTVDVDESLAEADSGVDHLDGEWHFLTIAHNVADETVVVGIDEYTEEFAAAGALEAATTADIHVELFAGPQGIRSVMDEFLVANRPISSQQRIALYNDGAGRAYPPNF